MARRAALLVLAALARPCAAEQPARARRRPPPPSDDLLLSPHMPPAERALTRGDALRLLRRVNVLGEDGAWSLDIGGSLAKVAFFRRRDASLPSCSALLGGCASLAAESLHVPALGGDIHFVLFETRDIGDCLEFVDRFWVRGLRDGGDARRRGRRAARPAAAAQAETAAPAGGALRRTVTMRATGGGSHKYREAFERIGVRLQPRDEMRSMVHGLNFLLTSVQGEAFSVDAGDPLSPLSPERAAALARAYLPPQASPFPYLFVSIGTGVSILEVTGWGQFRRVDGSSIGGGTFWGLCALLLRCGSFGELIALTERGVSSNVDMLVGDIYGGHCASHGLKSDVIAASFGKVLARTRRPRGPRRLARALASGAEGALLDGALLLGRLPVLSVLARRAGLARAARRRRARLANGRLSGDFRAEDIALSLLRLVSNNVGQLACLNAQKHGLSRIFFGGSFIRNHPYTVATLANAVKFFSKGTVEALFLKREGFVGALGALLDADEPLLRARSADGGARARPAAGVAAGGPDGAAGALGAARSDGGWPAEARGYDDEPGALDEPDAGSGFDFGGPSPLPASASDVRSLEGLSLEPPLTRAPAAAADAGAGIDLMAAIEQTAQGLCVGELVHGELFSLAEAMSALEMMDPQMDSGMAKAGGAPTIAPDACSAWDGEELRPRWHRPLSARETLGTLDELLALLMLHLRGHALAQTVFRCAYAHEPEAAACELLRLGVRAVLRAAEAARVAAVRANVCAEEDFVTSTAGLPPPDGPAEPELLDALGRAAAEVRAQAQASDPRAPLEEGARAAPAAPPAGWGMLRGASVELLLAFDARLRLLRALILLLGPLCRHTRESPAAFEGEAAGAHAEALAQLPLLSRSLGLGAGADELGFCFSAQCTAHVRGSAPQRLLPPACRAEAVGACAELVTQLARLPRLLALRSLDELLLGYADLCTRGQLQPIARVALRLLVLGAHEADEEGAPTSLRALLLCALCDRNRALPPGALGGLLGSGEGAAALGKLANGLLVHLQTFCHNDARRRRKLGKLLLEWGGVQAEAEEADLALQRGGGLPPDAFPLSRWLAAHTAAMAAEHARLGLRLRLLHPTELHAAAWHLHGLHALGAQLLAHAERQSALAAEQGAAAAAREAAARSKGWAKRRQMDALKDGAGAGPACAAPTLPLHEALRELSRGSHLLLCGLIRQGLMQPCEQGGLMSLRERFDRRHAHLRTLAQPPPPDFARYAQSLQLGGHSALQLYEAAGGCFRAARHHLDAALRWAHCELSEELGADVRAMAKAAVQNGVAAAQLARRAAATPPGAPPQVVCWEIAPLCDLPVLTLHDAEPRPRPPG